MTTTQAVTEMIEAHKRWIAGQQILNTSISNQLIRIEINNAKRDKYIHRLEKRIMGVLIAQIITILGAVVTIVVLLNGK